jgi:hypothetical protein
MPQTEGSPRRALREMASSARPESPRAVNGTARADVHVRVTGRQ